jgi:hypothetical protein
LRRQCGLCRRRSRGAGLFSRLLFRVRVRVKVRARVRVRVRVRVKVRGRVRVTWRSLGCLRPHASHSVPLRRHLVVSVVPQSTHRQGRAEAL